MRKIKAFAALLLVFSILLCLPACSCGKEKTQTWVCNYNITNLINSALITSSSDLSIPEEAVLYIPFELKLEDDGTCTLRINEESAKKYFDAYLPYLHEATVNQMYALYAEMGISKEDANALVEYNVGMTIEEYARQAMASFVSYDSLYGDFENYSYVYNRSGNTVNIASDKKSLDSSKYSYIGNIDGDTLTLKLVNNIPAAFADFGIDTSLTFNKK